MRSRSGRATSSMRSTSRVTSRARHVGTVTSHSSETSKPKPRRVARCSSGGTSSPIRRDARSGRRRTTGRAGSPCLNVHAPSHPRSGQVDEQATRENGRVLGEVRIDALLPAVRARRAQREPLGRALDPERLEVRRFQEHLGRRVRDLAVLASHDRGQRDRALAVRDEEVGGLETSERPVECSELLSGVRAPHDDAPVRELRAVECMERASPHVHDVVRDVHDVRDRPHLGEEEARAQPLR